MAHSNSIYISRSPSSLRVYSSSEEIPEKETGPGYFKIELQESLIHAEYAKLFFTSELGQLMLSHLPQGLTMPILNAESVSAMSIYVPDILEQSRIIELAKKLEIATCQLSDYRKELVTKPALLEDIKEKTDKFVYDLSSLSAEARVKQLLLINETKHIEFKQCFFLRHDQVFNEAFGIQRDEDEQRKVLKNIASFLNTEGGMLLIGVNDEGEPTGINMEMKRLNMKKVEKYCKDVDTKVKVLLGAGVSKFMKLSSVDLEGKTVVVVDCERSPTPVFCDKSEFYIRRAAESDALCGHDMLNYINVHFQK